MLNTIFGSLSSGVAASTSSYESISTVTVGSGGSASISFTSIPATYTHLQIRAIARTDRSAYFLDFGKITFNSDSGANYTTHQLYGDGSSAIAYSATAQNYGSILRFTAVASPTPSNTFGAAIVDILDYANTNKYKTIRNLGGADTNGAGELGLYSGLWLNTSAISSINIAPVGTQFNQYSQFALYGIKGA